MRHDVDDRRDKKTVDRPVGRAAGGSAAGHRARRVCRRHQFSAPASYAHRALGACPWPHRLDRHRGGARAARRLSRCGPRPTSPTCRRSISAKARIPALDPYRQPVLASDRVRYVGDPVAAVFAADPYIAEDAADLVAVEIEELPPLLDAQAAPAEFSPGHRSEAAIIRQGYGDVDAVFRDAPHVVEARARRRPAFRRAAGNPRRHRPLRRRARHSRTARRRQGAAPHPGTAVAHARPAAERHPRPRIPCRRRLRRARRALSRGRAGLRRRQKIQSRR